jgi:hypothetical protein
MPTSLSNFLNSQNQGVNPWTRKTSNYTAVNGDRIIADTTSASFTITLPATPTVGHNLIIVDGNDWSVNNLIIARNGSTIEGLSEDLTVDIGTIKIEIVYDGTTWEVFSTITGGGGGGEFSPVNYIVD